MKKIKKIYHCIIPESVRRAIRQSDLRLEKNLKQTKKFIRIWSPDAFRFNGKYPEILSLWKKWIYGNEYNNCGDFPRFYSMVLNLNQIIEEKIEGAFAELGVYKGNSAALLGFFAKTENRKLYLFDTFEGFDLRDLNENDIRHKSDFLDTSLDLVRRNIGYTNAVYVKGYFPESIPCGLYDEKYAFVSLDCDLYEPMKAGLNFFWPRLSGGGIIFCHDYSSGCWTGAKLAVDEFVSEHKLLLVLLPDKSGTAVMRKEKLSIAD